MKIQTLQPRARDRSFSRGGDSLEAPQVRYTPQAFGSAVGAAITELSTNFAETWKKSEKFYYTDRFLDEQANLQNAVNAFRSSEQADTANYFDRQEALVSQRLNAFMDSVPGHLREEFSVRANQLRLSYSTQGLEYGNALRNNYYGAAIEKAVTAEKNILDKDPEQLALAKERVSKYIVESGLDAGAQVEAVRRAAQALDEAAYRRGAANIAAGKGIQPADNAVASSFLSGARAKGLTNPNALAAIAATGQHESGFSAKRAQDEWDDPSEKGVPGRSGGVLSWRNERLERLRAYAKSKGETGNGSPATQGEFMVLENPELTKKLQAAKTPEEALTLMNEAWKFAGYNREGGERAARFGTLKLWAPRIGAMPADGTAVNVDAAGVQRQTQYANHDANPVFAAMPPERRRVLQADGEAESNRIIAQQKAAAETQKAQDFNKLYVDLNDGKAGAVDIQNIREKYPNADFKEINQAQRILEEKLGAVQAALGAQAMIDSGAVWVSDNAAHKKLAEARFGQEGLAAITSGNQAYVENKLLPDYQKMQMLAPSAVGGLIAMTQQTDAQKAAFGWETMRRLREISPESFVNQFGKEIQRSLDQYDARRNFEAPDKIAQRLAGGGGDTKTRAAQFELRKIARDWLSEEKNDPGKLAAESFDEFTPGFLGGYAGTPPPSAVARSLLRKDYSALFEDNFVFHEGDVKLAKEATDKQLREIWGVTSIGGTRQLMRLPPEKVGYKPDADGGYSYIDREVRQLIPPGAKYTLRSDDVTEKEANRVRVDRATAATRQTVVDPNAPPERIPPYIIEYVRPDGMRGVVSTPDGKPARVWFRKTDEEIKRDEQTFADRAAEARENEILGRGLTISEFGQGEILTPERQAEITWAQNSRAERAARKAAEAKARQEENARDSTLRNPPDKNNTGARGGLIGGFIGGQSGKK